MTSIIQRRPLHEPVTTEELKAHLRLEEEDEASLQALIATARLMVEAQTGLRLMTQIWSQVFPYQLHGSVRLSHWPIRLLKTISILGDTPLALDLDKFVFMREGRPARVRPKTGDWPQLRSSQYGFSFDIEVGFGSERNDVPEDLRYAVLVLAAEWYESNDWNAHASAAIISPQVMNLLQPHRQIHL
jgi:uncharacterized phiE125 gp8 family phage protein